MKDNLDIEKLFKDKFENFEGDVNPQMWQNISQGISSQAAASTGMTLGVKAALVASAVVITVGVSAYLGGVFDNKTSTVETNETVIIDEIKTPLTDVVESESDIIVAEENDPVINENKTEIIESLNQHTVVYNTATEQTELVEQMNVESDNNITNSDVVTTTETQTTTVDIENNQSDEDTHVNDVVEKDESENLIYPTGRMDYESTTNIFEFNFKSNAVNAVNIKWDFGDGYSSTKENPSHVYQTAGEYTVQLTLISKDNEMYQESKIIEIKGSSSIDNIPNVITPNGDRINDEFVIKTTDLKTFSIIITDQFGKTIFESKDPDFSWDGTDLSGNTVEKSMYIYYIIAVGNDGSTYKIPGQIYVR